MNSSGTPAAGTPCVFVSDLHGRLRRYETLFTVLREERPAAVFLGGDLLPNAFRAGNPAFPDVDDFLGDYLLPRLDGLRAELGEAWPRIFAILGNDDPRSAEAAMLAADDGGYWTYLHRRSATLGGWTVHGYACVPPTPFRLKDWERYDVSRYVDPGCIAPDEGMLTVPSFAPELASATIAGQLAELAGEAALDRALFLFHAPPYRSALDRAALDGKMVDHAPLDVHVGSIALRRFIETRQPRLCMHGHVHEAARLTGRWRDAIGATQLYGAAHDGPELAIVRFDPAHPEQATRELR